ncbi:MAG: hypothetical protein JWR85_3589 [Marmoricola sp.]|nr:hypothetical protein [Marmoricola sp.]
MPAVPLGVGAYKRAAAFTPEVRMLNLYLEPDKSGLSPDNIVRIQRPGLVLDTTFDGEIRALDYRITTDSRITVAGSSLYENADVVGSIGGEGIAPLVGTTFVYAIVGGGQAYLYTEALAVIAIPEGRVVVDVDQLNQYVLILCSDGTFYWLVPGETTLDPLNFATAESLPDKAVSIRRVGDEFWIFGTDTVEIWQATGDLDAPFQRVAGRQYERGCMARDTVRRFDNSVMWVSDDGQVCRGAAVAQVISDNGISERIRQRTALPSAWTFALDGHEFYVLRIPGQGTFAFDAMTSSWCEFGTLGRDVWAPHVGTQYQGITLAGDSATGAVWAVDGEAATDAGTAIETTVTGTYGFLGKGPRNDSLSIGVGSSADTVIRLRWKDGQEDYPEYYEELEARAPIDVVSIYRLGQPDQPYRTVEISHIGTERIRIAGCVANQSWQ